MNMHMSMCVGGLDGVNSFRSYNGFDFFLSLCIFCDKPFKMVPDTVHVFLCRE